VVRFTSFELKPFRAGQVVVAPAGAGVAAYRSVRHAGGTGLEWRPLDPASSQARAAVAAFEHFSGADAGALPRIAVSRRQTAQLCAHRAALLALNCSTCTSQVHLCAIDQVLQAVAGNSSRFALEQLPALGLDIDASADRQALQLAINVAEAHLDIAMLDNLDIRPFAVGGIAAASMWITAYATPAAINYLVDLATHDDVARSLLTYRARSA